MTDRVSHRLIAAGVAKFARLTADSDPTVRRDAVEKLLCMTDYGNGEGSIASSIIVEEHPYVLALRGNSVFCTPPSYTTIAHAVAYHEEPAERMYEKMPEYSAVRDSDGSPVLHSQVVASYRVAGSVAGDRKFLTIGDNGGFITAQVMVDWILSQYELRKEYEPKWLEVFDKLVDTLPEVLGMRNKYGGTTISIAYGKPGHELTMGEAIASHIHDFYQGLRAPTAAASSRLVAEAEPDQRTAVFTNALRRYKVQLDERTRNLLRSFP